MTDTTKTEALADEYARCAAKAHVESLYGTSKSYTAECQKDENEARAELIRAISAVEAERDRLAAELSFINDTAREYFAKQGMAETLDAKHPALIVRQMASEILRQRKECDRLAAECEALRADAERYRWLRSSEDITLEDLQWQLVRDYGDEYLDAKIDAAIGGKE